MLEVRINAATAIFVLGTTRNPLWAMAPGVDALADHIGDSSVASQGAAPTG